MIIILWKMKELKFGEVTEACQGVIPLDSGIGIQSEPVRVGS